MFFDIELDNEEVESEIKEENSDDMDGSENENSNNKLNINDSENELLCFDEFHPKKTIKTKNKRNYRENFGDDNDLKKFLDSLKLNSKSKK